MADLRADARPFDDFEYAACHAGQPQFATVAPQFVVHLLEDLDRGVLDIDHRAAVDHEHLRPGALLLGPYQVGDPLGIRKEQPTLDSQQQQARPAFVIGMVRTDRTEDSRAAFACHRIERRAVCLLRE